MLNAGHNLLGDIGADEAGRGSSARYIGPQSRDVSIYENFKRQIKYPVARLGPRIEYSRYFNFLSIPFEYIASMRETLKNEFETKVTNPRSDLRQAWTGMRTKIT